MMFRVRGLALFINVHRLKVCVVLLSCGKLEHVDWGGLILLEKCISQIAQEVNVMREHNGLFRLGVNLLEHSNRVITARFIQAAHWIVDDHKSLGKFGVVQCARDKESKGK